MVLRITPEVRDQMFAHALRGLPNEACGMFSAARGAELVDVFHPMSNVAESPKVFELDGHEMLDVERTIDAADRVLLGVMHSHTTTSPYPSPTDVRDVGRFDPFGAFRHLIVSLQHGDPALRCFTILGDKITEVLVVVDDGQDVYNDGSGAAVAEVTLRPI